MRRPQNHNPEPVQTAPAPLYVQDMPEVREAIQRAVDIGQADPSLLNGQFSPDALQNGSIDLSAVNVSKTEHLGFEDVPPAPFSSPELESEPERLREARQRDIEQARQIRAAALGTTPERMFSGEAMRNMYAQEPQYTITVMKKAEDPVEETHLWGCLNGVQYTVQYYVPVTVPYSVVRQLVELGRCTPPQSCPELMVVALREGSQSGKLNEVLRGVAYDGAGAYDPMTVANINQLGGSVTGLEQARRSMGTKPVITSPGFSFG